MHLTCTQPQLYSALQKVNRAIPPNSPIPSLTAVHLQATDAGLLSLTGTDLEFGVSVTISAEVFTPGQALIPARIFTDLIRHLPPVELTLKHDEAGGEIIQISTANSRINLNGMDTSQYPELPRTKENVKFEIPINLLQEGIKLVSIAAGSEEINNVFHSILWEIDNENLNLVATDTHRLAFFTKKIEKPIESQKILIPSRALNELVRLLPSEQEKVTIGVGDSYVYFEVNNLFLYSRIVAGQFPQYQQVIPQGFNTRAQVKTKDLQEAIERAVVITREETKTRSYVIKIRVEHNLNISSQAEQIGNLEENVEALVEGPPLEMIINGRYLLDVLRVFPEEEINLEFLTSLKPVIIRPVERNNYFCLILPIKTR
ncbi:MAG: polymerase subunit beta [Clostridia bacterium]|nr:polymerase subunit beta [Clostridia bacterium]